ncbi:unnamed protein product [Acanthoscelides obtectus]|uniref:Alpha-taxilin n=1 Tax=Acanthoscelides obtectus TaxID=200917 RepID=A0A9P0KVY4_ACAOB|nr:unnamed protein product [Acanthoscelides obtectus]CAK1627760.1 Alpha-taxilin [Acanthoscelides obtectus]
MGDSSSSQDTVGDSPPSSAVSKNRELRKSKRDQKSWENVYKGIAHLTEAEKLATIEVKYKELFTEYRATKATLKDYVKRYGVLQKDHQHISNELTKSTLSRTKMECLARELQKQNREIKEENYNRLKEEEDKRKVVAASFSEKLNTLTTLMDESTDKSLRLREENLNMTSKLTELYTQFQEREAHLTNMNNQMELQRKLSEAQLKKQEVGFEAERHLWQNEKLVLLDQLQKSEETNKVLQENIKTLQESLNTYHKQYSDFETTMKRSSEVFDTFKEEIAKMHKANAALEKERSELHGKWHSATQTIINLTELHQQAQVEQKAVERKVKMLEKLCRKLNTERSSYIIQLKENNIEPVTPNEDNEELSAKEKQIMALRGELKAIKEQLNHNVSPKTEGDEEEKSAIKPSTSTEVLRKPHSEGAGEKVSAKTPGSDTDESSDHSVHTIPLRESEASLDLPGLSRKCDVACSTSSLNLCDATIGQGEASSVQDEKKKKNKRARK